MTIPFAPHLPGTNGDGLAPAHVLRRLDDLEATVQALTERVDELEAADRPALPRDDLNQKILEFLGQYRGLKFTAFTVAENLGESNGPVGTRLRTLARNGLIETGQEDGRTRTFHMPAESD